MKNNVFFSCAGGFYKYMDDNKANLIVWKDDEFVGEPKDKSSSDDMNIVNKFTLDDK